MSVVLLHRKFRLPERCNCSDVVIRETNGIDEQRAALMADSRGERTNVYNELIRLSIVEVDGTPVTQPFTALEQWNSRTRAFIRAQYEVLNDISDEEVAVSKASGEDVTPAYQMEAHAGAEKEGSHTQSSHG